MTAWTRTATASATASATDDADGDGHDAEDHDGDDCDDADEDISLDEGTPYDGVDQDCDGVRGHPASPQGLRVYEAAWVRLQR